MAKDDWHALYCYKQWQHLRKRQLIAQPLCVYCSQLGRVTAANTVDHVIAHKGDRSLFFDETNLQSLCKACHDSHKRSLELRGSLRGCDVNGVPFDRRNAWHAPAAG